MKIIEKQRIPHPYTYQDCDAYKCVDDDGNIQIRWFSGDVELPPFFGYGEDAQEKVNQWYKEKGK
jgi:coproporphyrinogen III oxidase